MPKLFYNPLYNIKKSKLVKEYHKYINILFKQAWTYSLLNYLIFVIRARYEEFNYR